ncbi:MULTISPECIES: hypothetical protein [unclassified Methylophaga]|uniref:hypothetical protein n=1 Tax=unclassified Methylophaga TaxID=2629249 RepID=UPI000C88F6C9|nr:MULTISPECIES: hypothetical protein [unclassified Methylophaga]MBN46318.1 hypothetical protein [Methylophaga sp.]|tara:strand:+ start:62638 stop:62850 length:213 start_codon:yes stop_codon:yes gene_type:complete
MHTRPKTRNPNIDIGLAVLDIIRPDGVPLPYRFIADVCGCSPQFIYGLEQSAIRKLKQQTNGQLQDYLTD